MSNPLVAVTAYTFDELLRMMHAELAGEWLTEVQSELVILLY